MAAAVLGGDAGPELLESYNDERIYGADENILNSSRSTNFMSPKPGAETLFREAVLDLAERAPFARLMVNSGRLSVPCVLDGSSLNTADETDLPEASRPGASLPDAPLGDGWLLNHMAPGFTLLIVNAEAQSVDGAKTVCVPANETITERFLGTSDQAFYLVRPDQHVAARWTRFEASAVRAALNKAKGF